MTLSIDVTTRCWRILSPRWAYAPLSGDGAARHGGRWNRPNHPTLYLSETIEAAFAEYQQEMGVRPGTFVAYDVADAQIVDLTDASTLAGLNVPTSDLLIPWKETAFVQNIDPPTWRLADRLAGTADGVRVPSAQYPGGVNMVLWRWNAGGGPTVRYFDPKAELGANADRTLIAREGKTPS